VVINRQPKKLLWSIILTMLLTGCTANSFEKTYATVLGSYLHAAGREAIFQVLAPAQDLSRQFPGEANAWVLLGRIQSALGNQAEALTALATAWNTDTKNQDAAIWYGRLLLSKGKIDEGRAVLTKALSVNSSDSRLLYLLGRSLELHKDIAGALAMYEKSLAQTDQFSESALASAAIYRSYGLNDRARNRLQQAIALLPPAHPLYAQLTRAIANLPKTEPKP
jgi:tetratricopeptide (TPR) repeat protein